MRWFVWCAACLLLCLCASAGGSDTREREGFPVGLMSYCPDPPKPVVIGKSKLKYLYLVVQGLNRSRVRYNYWSAKRIAKDPRIDFKRKTLILAIGYLDSTNFIISTTFANLYEDLGYNVILVDNNRFSTVHYFRASKLMKPVGKHVAEVLVQLSELGLDPSKLELLGFSLGCQTISYIAKNYQKTTGRNISRLTALSPAGPCFRTLGPQDRLNASDADFIDVVHTNIDGYGMATKMGHVDFYVNGGEFQPGDVNFIPCTTTCSHFRSLLLWESALKNPGKFIGLKCDSIQQARDSKCYDRSPLETNVLGLAVDRSTSGIYYLATGINYPYYLKEKGLSSDYVPWKIMNTVRDSDV